MKIAIIGPGRVGTALGEAFKKAGLKIVGIVSLSKKDAKKCMKLTSCPYWSSDLRKVVPTADLILITTPDSAIKVIVPKIKSCMKDKTILVHTSGTLPAGILGTKNAVGLHPIAAFVGGSLLSGTYFGVQGDIKIGKKLVALLGGIPIVMPPKIIKSLYHAGLNFGASYVLALLSTGKELMELSGFKNSERVILSLVKSTVINAETFGINRSFTGPLSRGDIEIVKEELKAIKKLSPNTLKIYKVLINETKKHINSFQKTSG